MTAEVLQTAGAFIVDEINTICQLVFKERHAPTQWTSSMMIPLPKKGNLELKTNFRGICLTSIAAKVYNRVILNRIREPIDAILRRNQAGFRKREVVSSKSTFFEELWKAPVHKTFHSS